MMLLITFLMLSVFGNVYGDFRIPILTAPFSTFPGKLLKGFTDENPEYFSKVTTYNVWQTPKSEEQKMSAFDDIVDSKLFIIFSDALDLLDSALLTVEDLEVKKLYDCPDQCYFVKDVDIIDATSVTRAYLDNARQYKIREIHELSVKAMEKKFCFNMTQLELKLNLSSLRVINDQWPFFVPDIVAAAVNCRADQLGVTVSELAELLNKNASTLYSYNLNQMDTTFFPAYDDLVFRKNLFETRAFFIAVPGNNTDQWQSQTMAYYVNETSQFSVRHLEIFYRWETAQLFAIEHIKLSSYFSECNNISTAGSAFDLSQTIFGYQTTLPSCNVAFVLSRSLSEDQTRFNLATITNRNILNIIRNASGISSWFNFNHLLFTLLEGIWMETPLIMQIQTAQNLSNAQVINYSVPQIAHAIRNLNESGGLTVIMSNNYQQYLSLLLQTYGMTKSSLALLTGITEAQIDTLTIQQAHNLALNAIYVRYNISEFFSKLNISIVDNYVAINLPSFEWYRLVRAAIESSFDQLASAFSTNLTAGTSNVSFVTLPDGTFSIQIQPGNTTSNFVISASRLASCLGTTTSEIYQRTMTSYQTLYQGSVVDLMNRKNILETENFDDLIARVGIAFENIEDSTTVGEAIYLILTAEQLQCMYGWSSEFVSFLNETTWRNVSSYRLCADYTSWSLYRIAVALQYSTPTICELCSFKPCDVNANCTNTIGSYICTCHTGFTGNGTTCNDIDECAINADNCHNTGATCSNTHGSWTCACNVGYSGDGVTCVDIDECAINTDNCDSQATCVNTNGSFTCACNLGYSGDGVTCVDIDECAINADNCNNTGAICSNTPGSWTCACNVGYSGDGVVCVDIDECAINTDNCDSQATCVNTNGSFTCGCDVGYSGDGVTCIDIDECAINADNCHNTRAICSNTPGSWTCACSVGYSGDGVTCVDIDECTLSIDLCDDVNGRCFNVNGSYTCTCNDGYRGNGIVCVDIDECAENIDNCDANGVCTNNPGSYTCACSLGFTGNGFTCFNIDECALNTDNCHVNATCTDTVGSFTCQCKTGFVGNGVSCVPDVDECALGTHTCSSDGICSNTIGSYTCGCKVGYSGDGSTCSDIDECAINTDNCDSHATCVNNNGSFACGCEVGYSGDGVTCVDINECAINTDNCGSHATCVNNNGSFTCGCEVGYSGDGVTCADIDECSKNKTLCSSGLDCINTLGSFECVCNGRELNGQCIKGFKRYLVNLRLNEKYTNALKNKTSDEFKRINSRIGDALQEVYANNDNYLDFEIEEFTNGSIIANLDLLFKDSDTTGLSDLLVAVRNTTFGDFDIGKDALTVVITGTCPSDHCPGNSTCKTLSASTISCPCNAGFYFDGITCKENIVIDVEITLEKTFVEELNNKSSPAYIELENNVTAELTEAFKDTPNFQAIIILAFRNGSVIVEFKVIYRQDPKLNKKVVVAEALKEKIIEGKLGRLKVKGNVKIQGTPPPPKDLKHTDVTENSIVISWNEPTGINFFTLSNYTVSYKTKSDSHYTQKFVLKDLPKLNLVLKDLESDTFYEITVHGNNEEGAGDKVKLEVTTEKPESSVVLIVVIIVVVVAFLLIVFAVVCVVVRKRKSLRHRRHWSEEPHQHKRGQEPHALSMKAHNDVSDENEEGHTSAHRL